MNAFHFLHRLEDRKFVATREPVSFRDVVILDYLNYIKEQSS
jgi:hypothetical protein